MVAYPERGWCWPWFRLLRVDLVEGIEVKVESVWEGYEVVVARRWRGVRWRGLLNWAEIFFELASAGQRDPAIFGG